VWNSASACTGLAWRARVLKKNCDCFWPLTCFLRVRVDRQAALAATDGLQVSCEARANVSFTDANVSLASVTGVDDWWRVTCETSAIDSMALAHDGLAVVNASLAGAIDSLAGVKDAS
jgi:hypothetical protein